MRRSLLNPNLTRLTSAPWATSSQRGKVSNDRTRSRTRPNGACTSESSHRPRRFLRLPNRSTRPVSPVRTHGATTLSLVADVSNEDVVGLHERLGAGGHDTAVLAAVALLPILQLPVFLLPGFTPRLALMLAMGPIGIVSLWRLAMGRDRAAIAAGSLVIWIPIAALFSGHWSGAFRGTLGREMSGLIVVLGLALWAAARNTSPSAQRWVPTVLLASLALNALVAVAQVVLDVDTGDYALQSGRAAALTPNPVYLGGLMAGGAALAASHARMSPMWRYGLTLLFAVGVNLSGSRVAAAAGLIAVSVGVFAAAERRTDWRLVTLPALYLVGVVLSTGVSNGTDGDVNGGSVDATRTATERISETTTGGRLDVWGYGWRALWDRPITGWGFGRFRAGTQGYFDADFVRTAASDDLRQAWFDAHNIIVNVLVAVGLVGFALTVWFVWTAVRRASGPLLIFALGLGATFLVQPPGLATLPVALLALGAAAPSASRDSAEPEPSADATGRTAQVRDPVASVGALIGLLLAGWLVVGDLLMKQATEPPIDAGGVVSAARWFPGDPLVADLAAQASLFEYLDGRGTQSDVVEWSTETVEREPDRPYFWNRHARRLMFFEEYDPALAALDQALELEPWHLQSWQTMFELAALTDDADLADLAATKLCELGQELDSCAAEP